MCAPAAPNAMATAGAQTNSNVQTAIAQTYLNQPNQKTPYGSISSSIDGYNTVKGPNGEEYQLPKFTQTTTLDPYQQNIYETGAGLQHFNLNTASQQAGQLRDTVNEKINTPAYNQFASSPKLQTNIKNAGQIQRQIGDAGQIQMSLGNEDTWGRVQDVENAMFARYNPQLEQDRQRMEAQLANQGVRNGSTAWNNAMDAQSRNVNDARLGITINAGQEQNRLQQLALNSGNFANSAQAQNYGQLANNGAFANAAQQQQYGQNANDASFSNAAKQQMFSNNFNVNQANNGLADSSFANAMAKRNQLINEQSALTNGAQVTNPQFAATPQTSIGGTDVGSLVNQQYKNQYDQYSDMWGGIGSAAKGLFSLSDERAKKNVEKIGMMGKGLPLYSYEYKGSDVPQIGVLAQEAEKVVPSAVRTRPDGLKEVNYPKLTMAMGIR